MVVLLCKKMFGVGANHPLVVSRTGVDVIASGQTVDSTVIYNATFF